MHGWIVQVWTALNAEYIERQAAKMAATSIAEQVGALSSVGNHRGCGEGVDAIANYRHACW